MLGRAWIAQNVSADHRHGGGRKRGTKMPPPALAGIMATVSSQRGEKLARESRLLDIELQRRSGELPTRIDPRRADPIAYPE